MRLFLHTYSIPENWEITRQRGVFGVKDDSTGLATKARRLQEGDQVVIRDGRVKWCPRFFECCVIAGSVVDQRVRSPFPDLLWHDEIVAGRVIYPIRVSVTFARALVVKPQDLRWEDCDNLGLLNQKGRALVGLQCWGKKFMGNLIDHPRDRDAIGSLIFQPAG